VDGLHGLLRRIEGAPTGFGGYGGRKEGLWLGNLGFMISYGVMSLLMHC